MWFLLFLLGLYLIASAVVALAVFYNRQAGAASGSGAGPWTRFFLVCLRLAIGWHFVIEGFSKPENWTGEPYLRESVGPAAPFFRWVAGDNVLDRLTLGPNGEFPEPLAAEWQAYFDRFQGHYGLEGARLTLAQTKFDQSKSNTITWIKSGKKVVPIPSSQPPPLLAELSVAERIALYQKKEELARDLEANHLPYYGAAVHGKWKEAKAEANKMRNDLKADLALQTATMKNNLLQFLTKTEMEAGTMSPALTLSVSQWSRLDWSDFTVKYGLIAVGVLLLAGLLTRTACVAGALFLLSFYLAMPPLPGLPDNPRSEGHYLLINKNLVEMLALLALATTRSGRWAGLDGLIQFLNPWRKGAEPATAAAVEPAAAAVRPDDATEMIPAARGAPRDTDVTLTIAAQDTNPGPGKAPAASTQDMVPAPGTVSPISKEIPHGT